MKDQKWNEEEFIALLKEGKELGVEYNYSDDESSFDAFQLTYKGKQRWKRDTPAGLKRLLRAMIKAIKEKRL